MSSLTHRQLRRAFASSRVTVPAQGCHRSAGSANRTRTAQLPAWCRMSPRTTARSGTEPTVSWTITWVDDEEPARMGRTGEQRGRRVDTEPPGCFHFGNSPPVTHAATSILTNGGRPRGAVTQIKRTAQLPQSSPPPLGIRHLHPDLKLLREHAANTKGHPIPDRQELLEHHAVGIPNRLRATALRAETDSLATCRHPSDKEVNAHPSLSSLVPRHRRDGNREDLCQLGL